MMCLLPARPVWHRPRWTFCCARGSCWWRPTRRRAAWWAGCCSRWLTAKRRSILGPRVTPMRGRSGRSRFPRSCCANSPGMWCRPPQAARLRRCRSRGRTTPPCTCLPPWASAPLCWSATVRGPLPAPCRRNSATRLSAPRICCAAACKGCSLPIPASPSAPAANIRCSLFLRPGGSGATPCVFRCGTAPPPRGSRTARRTLNPCWILTRRNPPRVHPARRHSPGRRTPRRWGPSSLRLM